LALPAVISSSIVDARSPRTTRVRTTARWAPARMSGVSFATRWLPSVAT
jgi:hypothetical protein